MLRAWPIQITGKAWMPDQRESSTKRHSQAVCCRFTWVILLLAAFSLCGCRAFRCKRVSDESINDARQLSLQARDAQQKGHWEQAEEFYAAAVARCPTDERARCGYAEALWQRGAKLDAVAHMEEGVRLSGDDPERVV